MNADNEDTTQTTEQQELPEGAITMEEYRQRMREREKLFESFPVGTLAALGITCAAIGSGSLGCELLLSSITKTPPPGFLIGLPIPFISTPLGLGATIIALIIFSKKRKASTWPIIAAVSYWALYFWAWP